MSEPSRACGKTFVVEEIRSSYCCAKCTPLLIVFDCNSDPAIGPSCRVDTVWSHLAVSVTHASLHATIGSVIQESRTKEMEGRFGLGLVNVLPLLGATSMIER